MTSTMTLWDDRSVPRVGIGTWAIGGHFVFDGRADGWGDVDDAQSARALALAVDMGARVFDTADVYGTGRSETVVGRALAPYRRDVLIATKFGFTYDEAAKTAGGTNLTPAYIEQALAASLRRLGTDWIDLYQIHVGGLSDQDADRVAETLERLCGSGRIRAWGWSTDDARAAARMKPYPHFVAVQQQLNVFEDGPEMLALCERENLVSLNRSPLAMGFLTGKFDAASKMPVTDVRGAGHSWVPLFKDGVPDSAALARLASIRDLLQTGGRTLAQGALGWILARSPQTLPVPGIKSEAQVRDNLGVLEQGPLSAQVMAEIESLLRNK